MSKVKFYLKNPKAKESSVFMVFNFGYSEVTPSGHKKHKFLKYGINEIIPTAYWDDKLCRVKETKKFPEYPELNHRLGGYERAVKDIHRKMLNDGIQPTPELLRAALNDIYREPLQVKKKIGLFDFIEEYIATSNKSPSTKEKYVNTFRTLKLYTENRKLEDFTFDDVDLEFYDDFVSFLYDKEYAENSVGSHIKNIKVFMAVALDRGLTDNRYFQHKRFKKVGEESESIYLNEEELDRIFKLDLSNNSRLDRVRDLFIVGCYTGLRFSDLSQIKKENFVKVENVQCLKITTQKTGEVVVIPLKSQVKKILTKYDFELPRLISNQKFNNYTKEIAELAEIDEKLELTISKGGKSIKNTYHKYELVTAHTARRSFATNAYLAGIPSISIMKITGHRTDKSFMRYIKITQEENAVKLSTHKFFK